MFQIPPSPWAVPPGGSPEPINTTPAAKTEAPVDAAELLKPETDVARRLHELRTQGLLPQLARSMAGQGPVAQTPLTDTQLTILLRKLAQKADGGDVAALMRSFHDAGLPATVAHGLRAGLRRDVKFYMPALQQQKFVDDMHSFHGRSLTPDERNIADAVHDISMGQMPRKPLQP